MANSDYDKEIMQLKAKAAENGITLEEYILYRIYKSNMKVEEYAMNIDRLVDNLEYVITKGKNRK